LEALERRIKEVEDGRSDAKKEAKQEIAELRAQLRALEDEVRGESRSRLSEDLMSTNTEPDPNWR